MDDLTDTALARALTAGLDHTGAPDGERVAVSVLITHGTWLARPELRRNVVLDQCAASLDDVPRVVATVLWDDVAAAVETSPASTGEQALLRLACSLAGRLPHANNTGVPALGPSREWTLGHILRSLDPRNALLACRAVAATAIGPHIVGSLDPDQPTQRLPRPNDPPDPQQRRRR